MNYNSAVNYCKNQNMELVRINNYEINKRVFDIAVKYKVGWYWIDGNDNVREGNWVDSKNIPLQYKNWHSAEPNGGRKENCIHGLFYGNALWNDIPCTNLNAVICQKIIPKVQNVEHGYHLNKDKMNYNSAVNYCKKQNMELITINNIEINKRVFDIAVKYKVGWYWIDGNDNVIEGNWVDSKNIPFQYKNWHSAEPNGGRRENCIHGLFYGNALWNDIPCTYLNAVICQKSKPTVQNVEYGYLLNKEKMNYYSAMNYCKKQNMELVTINNVETNKRVFDIAVKYNAGWYWINGNDNSKEGNWMDSRNIPLQYKNWKIGEPNGDRSENCIHGLFYGNALWNDISCNDINAVICDISKVQNVEYGYLLNKVKMDYNSAVNYCKGQNMELVTINNAVINNRVFYIAAKYNIGWYWINGNDNAKEGIWMNSRNKLIPYKNWFRMEPNGGRTENCIHGLFHPYGFWNDISCTNQNAVICEPIKQVKVDPEICNTIKELCFHPSIASMCKMTCELWKKIPTSTIKSVSTFSSQTEPSICELLKKICSSYQVSRICKKTCEKVSTKTSLRSTSAEFIKKISTTTKKSSEINYSITSRQQSSTPSINEPKICSSMKGLCFNSIILDMCPKTCVKYTMNKSMKKMCLIPIISRLLKKICDALKPRTTTIAPLKPKIKNDVEFGYHYTKEKMDYKSALKYCKKLNMDLVTIDNAATNKLVHDLSVKYNVGWFWINGNDNKTEGMWVDSNNNQLSYTNWNLKEPDGGKYENCIHVLFYNNGYWNDIECSHPNSVICEPVRQTKIKFHISKTKMGHDEAVNYCKNRNMDLVKIDNSKINVLVYNLAVKNNLGYYWINGNDKLNEGIWINTDNEEISYKNWYWGEPNGYRRENCICGHRHPNEFWSDADCDSLYSVICQPIEVKKTQNFKPTFYFTREKMNNLAALQFCRNQNMQLIKVDNAEKNNAVFDFAIKNNLDYYWINGNDKTKESHWVDSKNNELNFKNWYSMKPDGGHVENCIIGLFHPDGLWDDTHCDSLNSVICERINNTKMGYHFTTDKMDFNTAINYCKDQNMELITINDAKTNFLVYNLSMDSNLGRYWINGNDNAKEGNWVDNRNNPLIFKNWKKTEPNGVRHENCISGNYYPDALWNDARCDSLNSVICEPIKYRNITYHLTKTKLNYKSALEYCKSRKMDIVRIENDKNNKLIFDMAIKHKLKSYWINGNDYINEGHWVDTTNRMLTYKNWNKLQPDGARKANCIHGLSLHRGLWNDVNCDFISEVICENRQ